MTTSGSTIWRLHLLPKGENPPKPEDVVKFCHAHSVLGMGWAVDADLDENISWSDYVARSKDTEWKKVNDNVRRWKEDVKTGDLVWTKTPNKEYYLARVIGEWRYEPAAKFVAVDMVNIREVKFVFVGDKSQMPDKIVKKFIDGQTLQRVNGVDELSRDLWNKHCPPTSPKYLER